MSHIVSIAYSPAVELRQPPDRYHRVVAERAVLVPNWGIEGDIKGTKGKRQLNVMAAAVLARLEALGLSTAPGAMGEQIVLGGVDVEGLPEGTLLHLGEYAVVLLGELRTGCDRFEKIQGVKRGTVKGMLGRLATVIEGGPIAVGDKVRVEEAEVVA